MFKFLLALVVGLAIGYSYGYKDAKAGRPTVVERVVQRTGGSNRGKYNQNLDDQTKAVDQH